MELAELREDVLQQLHSVEAVKMQMAEQKLAEQTRLAADLDVRLQAACTTLDCSAGEVTTQLTEQHQHVLCSSVVCDTAVHQILHSLYIRLGSNAGVGINKEFADKFAHPDLRFMLIHHCDCHNLSSTMYGNTPPHSTLPPSLPPAIPQHLQLF